MIMASEISYDLIMENDMRFVEGTYRLQDGEWKVFIFIKESELTGVVAKNSKWSSGVSGIVIRVPPSYCLNKQSVETLLSECLNVSAWIEVKGPDSLQIR
jgi:hypothetical protein